MSGPMRRAIARGFDMVCTEDEHGVKETHLERYCAWIREGWTRKRIATELATLTGVPILRDSVRNHLIKHFGFDDVRAAVLQAEEDGAGHLVEDAFEHIELADPDPATGEVTKARELARINLWRAERANPERYADKGKSNVNVSVTLGSLHLEALRARATITPLADTSRPALPAPAEIVEDSDDSPLTERDP